MPVRSRRPAVSVVIPTLNEARNLPLVLPYLPLDWLDEVILVDGRSTDGTVEVARQLLPAVRVILEHKRGKGAALQAGFAAATGEILVTMDADGSHDPREIPRLIEPLLAGADFVKGSRFAHGGGTTDMPRYRKLGNWALGGLTNLLFNGAYTDLCYGYHAFWRYCLESIGRLDADGFEIDTAIYVRLLRERWRVVEVPSFEGYRFHGIGKLKAFPDGWRVFKTILHEWLAGLRPQQPDVFAGFRGGAPDSRARHIFAGPPQPANAIGIVQQLSHELPRQPNAQERMRCVLQGLLDGLPARSGSLIVIDERGHVAGAVLARPGPFHFYSPQQLDDLLGGGLAGWVVRHRRPVFVASTLDDPRWLRRPWDDQHGLPRSAMSVPLISPERTCGALTLVSDAAGQFTQDDLRMLMTIVTCLSMLHPEIQAVPITAHKPDFSRHPPHVYRPNENVPGAVRLGESA